MPSSSSVVELVVPADPMYLQLIRAVVGAAASVDPDIHSQRVADLRLAVSEAATNAIQAHSKGGIDDRVVVRCNLDAARIEVEVIDRGDGFDPDALPLVPDAETRERLDWESGLGVPLMRQLADEAEFTSGEDGTAVKLVVYFPDR